MAKCINSLRFLKEVTVIGKVYEGSEQVISDFIRDSICQCSYIRKLKVHPDWQGYLGTLPVSLLEVESDPGSKLYNASLSNMLESNRAQALTQAISLAYTHVHNCRLDEATEQLAFAREVIEISRRDANSVAKMYKRFQPQVDQLASKIAAVASLQTSVPLTHQLIKAFNILREMYQDHPNIALLMSRALTLAETDTLPFIHQSHEKYLLSLLLSAAAGDDVEVAMFKRHAFHNAIGYLIDPCKPHDTFTKGDLGGDAGYTFERATFHCELIRLLGTLKKALPVSALDSISSLVDDFLSLGDGADEPAFELVKQLLALDLQVVIAQHCPEMAQRLVQLREYVHKSENGTLNGGCFRSQRAHLLNNLYQCLENPTDGSRFFAHRVAGLEQKSQMLSQQITALEQQNQLLMQLLMAQQKPQAAADENSGAERPSQGGARLF